MTTNPTRYNKISGTKRSFRASGYISMRTPPKIARGIPGIKLAKNEMFEVT